MVILTPTDVNPARGTNVSGVSSPDGGVPRFKVGFVTGGDTVDDTDSITIDIFKNFGMQRFLGIRGFIQTTANSVIAEEAPTTTYDMNELVITVGGSTNDKQRFYVVYGV